MVDVDTGAEHTRTERLGLAGIVAMLLAHLVWDPALTLAGVAVFGIAEEDTATVRALLRIHPVAWLAVKLVVLGGVTGVMLRLRVHRDPATAWVPWVIAAVGVVGPLGWLELLVLSPAGGGHFVGAGAVSSGRVRRRARLGAVGRGLLGDDRNGTGDRRSNEQASSGPGVTTAGGGGGRCGETAGTRAGGVGDGSDGVK